MDTASGEDAPGSASEHEEDTQSEPSRDEPKSSDAQNQEPEQEQEQEQATNMFFCVKRSADVHRNPGRCTQPRVLYL